MKQATYIFFITAFLIQCKTHIHLPGEYTGDVVTFGKGGGFTGRVNSYCLLDNGDIFSYPGDSIQEKYLGRIAKSKTDQIFKSYNNLGLDKQKINSPGNMYSFIEMRSKAGVHKTQWGSSQEKPTPEMKQFFTNLMHIIKTLEDSNN